MNRSKKAEDETVVKTGLAKRRGLLGKLGLKKKTKSPVTAAEDKAEEDTVEETEPIQEEAAPAEAEPTSEPLEPEAEKEDEEEPTDEDKEENDAPVEDRDEDSPVEGVAVTEEPKVEEQTADEEFTAAIDELADIEEREQPDPITPRTVHGTGFLCGCL